jgi:hypothetical protein
MNPSTVGFLTKQLTLSWQTCAAHKGQHALPFHVNPLVPELFFFLIFAHPVFKM